MIEYRAVKVSRSDIERCQDPDARYAFWLRAGTREAPRLRFINPCTCGPLELEAETGWTTAEGILASEEWSWFHGVVRREPVTLREPSEADSEPPPNPMCTSACNAEEVTALGRLIGTVLEDLGLIDAAGLGLLVYLALTSRLLEDPVSLVVKGPSSAGKSHLIGTVLRLFPSSAAIVRTSFSERALVFSTDDFRHRTLVLFEDDGAHQPVKSMFLRTLLSEKCLRYEVTFRTPSGEYGTRVYEKEGPTNLIVTTTAISLHPELETRMLSLTVSDSPEHLRNVLIGQTRLQPRQPNLVPWIGLQERLQESSPRVVVPYAPALAEVVEACAPRLLRDFKALLSLISSHALVRWALDEAPPTSTIETDLDDYEAVQRLTGSMFSEAHEQGVSREIQETVEAVRRLAQLPQFRAGVTYRGLAEELRIHVSSVSRRIQSALAAELLCTGDQRRGRVTRVHLADRTLHEERDVFPSRDALERFLHSRPSFAVNAKVQSLPEVDHEIADR